jgi:hypothetical protein
MHAKQYKFTLADLAVAANVPLTKVYRDVRLKTLNPNRLPEVAAYILYAETIKKVQASATPEDKAIHSPT